MALERIGEIAASGDVTTGANIRQEGSASREAVIEVIEPVAAGIIAQDPTLAQAAADKVDEVLQDAGVPSTGTTTDPDNAIAAIGDANGVPTRWLRWDAGGMPSTGALAAMSEAGLTIAGSTTDPNDPNAVGALGDAAGQPTAYRWDGFGRPSVGALAKFAEVGIPASVDVTDPQDRDAVGAIGDAYGNPTEWLRWDARGMPSRGAMRAIWRMLGMYRGPVEPTFFPTGVTYTWLVTDPSTGELLDIRNGVGN